MHKVRIRARTALAIINELIRSPKSIARVIGVDQNTYEEKMRKYVSDVFGLKLGLPVLDIVDLLPQLEEHEEVIHPYSFLEGQAGITDLALLKGLARRWPKC